MCVCCCSWLTLGCCFLSLLQLFKFQCEWTWVHFVVLLLSFGSWIGVAYIVSASTTIDSDYYSVRTARIYANPTVGHTSNPNPNPPHLLGNPLQTWSRQLQTAVFWLALVVICAMLIVKDLAISAGYRAFSTDPRLWLQEV